VSTSAVEAAVFDAARPYALHPQLALRPERFGALAYHYGNRRLTFLKSPQLTAIVEDLGEHASVDAALDAHGVTPGQRPAILTALARLQTSEVICVR
jgi:putative mycofactocin binding protein MftB